MTEPVQETINFEFQLKPNYIVDPPIVEILVDNVQKFYSPIREEKIISFDHTCSFSSPHQLTLIRTGQSSKEKEQFVQLLNLKIDGVNVKNIVYSKSYTIPIYPEPWATEQINAGITLPEKIQGVTHFGHNCTWYLDFTSPFYRYIMAWMGGGLHD